LATLAGLFAAKPSSARTADTGCKKVVNEKSVMKKRVKARRRDFFGRGKLFPEAVTPTQNLLVAWFKPLLFL
jgi:hypothetical protein